MSNLRLLPILLTIGLSLTTIGCQSDEPDPADSIVPETSTNLPASPNSTGTNAATRTANDPDATADKTKAQSGEDEDEFADGNYGEVDEDNTYRPRNKEFEVTLPEKYDIQPQRDGVAFVSDDGGFGGEVVFFKEEKPLDAEDLENALKKIYDELLDGASWQLSEIQPDGSVRLDWRGTTPEGKELDAVSYIEQRNDTVFILNVYGIDRPYDAFLDDSQTIIGSYLTWPDDEGEDDNSDNGDTGNTNELDSNESENLDDTDLENTNDDELNNENESDETNDTELDEEADLETEDSRVGAP
jgi:hypothetical protein